METILWILLASLITVLNPWTWGWWHVLRNRKDEE
jgi:hypothetical protein